MDQSLDQRDFWDEQSCREFEQMLDSREADEEAYAKWLGEKIANEWLAEREEMLSESS